MGLKSLIMKKFILFLQLAAFILFASCSDEDPDPAPQPPVIETNTIFVYMPWSGSTKKDPGLYSFFLTNIQDIKSAIVNQGGLGNNKLMIFISTKVDKGALINVQYKNGSCIDDTVAIYDNTQPGLRLNTAEWITTLLKRVKQEAPANHYSMIVGCHGMGWIPAKPSTRINRPAASLFGLNQNAGKAGPPTRWLGGNAYQTNISDFDKGIEDSGIGKFQYILFDDCNMTGIEVAYELRNATNHIIGSPTEIMAYGMPYKFLWSELSKVNPDYHSICTNFINFYSNYKYEGTPYPYGTISVIDCSQVEGMVDIMKEINASTSLSTITESNIQSMDGYTPSIFYDMGDYVRKLAQNEPLLLAKFNSQLDRLVPEKRHTDAYYTSLRTAGFNIIPIQSYSGITISDPSTNQTVTNSLGSNRYYQTTH
jgi:putative lipoprotein